MTADPKFPGPIYTDPNHHTDEELAYWMCFFVQEARRRDGQDYPPNTLTALTSGLKRYLNASGRPDFNPYNKEDGGKFYQFRKALDARMQELTRQGIGVHRKSADPVDASEEAQFWEKGVFDMTTSEGLSNAVFYYNGKCFGFRGESDHKNSEAQMYEIVMDIKANKRYLRYRENASKTNQGGLDRRKICKKEVAQYEDTENPHCVVKLFDLYLSLIPRKGPLYRKPLPENGKSKFPRFGATTISDPNLRGMFKKFYDEAGVSREGKNISNHSGRVTCVSALYNAGYDDNAVKSRTFHKSDAVHLYKKMSTQMSQSISNTLGAPNPHLSKANSMKPSTSQVPNTSPVTHPLLNSQSSQVATDSQRSVPPPWLTGATQSNQGVTSLESSVPPWLTSQYSQGATSQNTVSTPWSIGMGQFNQKSGQGSEFTPLDGQQLTKPKVEKMSEDCFSDTELVVHVPSVINTVTIVKGNKKIKVSVADL